MSAASPTTPPLLHGRYRILTRMGEGRLATVFQAEDERLRRKVLVHILRAELAQQPNLRQRFEEEAQRGAQRSHPGLLEVYDSGDVGGRPYMVTEDIAGQPLAEAALLSASEALGIVRTIVSAVSLAQSQGVPHPPISSRNVWLLTGGRTVLLENWHMSPGEIAIDLAPYRAPERVAGAPPSPATVVYALGVLAWEAFIGRRPFNGSTPDAIARQQRQSELPPISHERPRVFSPELDRIVAQAVASDPNFRYSTPIDFGRALDLYADATNALTGRLATLPTTGYTQTVAPDTVQQRRSARLPFPGRRHQAVDATNVQQAVAPQRSANPAARQSVAPPPPPPVIAAEPPPQTRTIVPPQRYDQRAIDQEIKRQVKREVRRQGCRRALIKRTAQLLIVFLVLYGAWLGINYAVDYARGQVQQINIGQWISQQLPDPNNLVPGWIRDLVQDPTSAVAQYRVTQPVNLRSEPRVADETFIARLEPGAVLQQLGPAQPDAAGQPYEWIQVIVINSGQRGWIANQAGRIERQ